MNHQFSSASWKNIPGRENIIDNNISIDDHYGPVCDSKSPFDIISDRVRTICNITTRKIFYKCQQCLLFERLKCIVG